MIAKNNRKYEKYHLWVFFWRETYKFLWTRSGAVFYNSYIWNERFLKCNFIYITALHEKAVLSPNYEVAGFSQSPCVHVKCPSKKRHLNFLKRAYNMARGGSFTQNFQYDVTLFILLAKTRKSQIRFLEERKTFVTLNAQFLFWYKSTRENIGLIIFTYRGSLESTGTKQSSNDR